MKNLLLLVSLVVLAAACSKKDNDNGGKSKQDGAGAEAGSPSQAAGEAAPTNRTIQQVIAVEGAAITRLQPVANGQQVNVSYRRLCSFCGNTERPELGAVLFAKFSAPQGAGYFTCSRCRRVNHVKFQVN